MEVYSNRRLIGKIRNTCDPSGSLSHDLAVYRFFYCFPVILRIPFIPCIVCTRYRILNRRRNTLDRYRIFSIIQPQTFRKGQITDHQISGDRTLLKIIYSNLIINLLSNPEFIFCPAVFRNQIWIPESFFNRKDCCIYINFRVICCHRSILCLYICHIDTFHSICSFCNCTKEGDRNRNPVWKI